MAGEWIKFELATLDKPEVIRMSRHLGLSKEAVCGFLIRFWGWYGANSVDGHVDGVASTDVDVVLSLPGFSEALKGVNWLHEDASKRRLTVPNFDYHNSESAKKRALSTRRQGKYRNALVDGRASTSASPEKRREEVKEAPPDGGPVWTECLTILTEQSISEKSARAFLGMLCRDYEEAEIVKAVKAAVGKADATAYVRGVLKAAPKKGEQLRRLAI